VVATGGVFSGEGRRAIVALDIYLGSQADNSLNPGTTADLIAVTLFVALLEGVLK
jgi:triphosphoribosyl-dephospho-CoA synthetase